MEPTPSSSLTTTIIVAVVVAFLAGGGAYAYEAHQKSTSEDDLQSQISDLRAQLAATSPTPTPLATAIVSPTPTSTPSSTPTPAATTYKTDFLSLSIPAGWTATQVPANSAAVNVTSGKYILYINVNASQASGVTGGRFAEIAQGAPSADAVVQSWPSDPCNAPVYTNATNGNLYTRRADLYVDSACSSKGYNAPSSGSRWYFSYLTGTSGGYFNDYTANQNPGLVISMAYNASSVSDLPTQGDSELSTALTQMTSIANSLKVLKQ